MISPKFLRNQIDYITAILIAVLMPAIMYALDHTAFLQNDAVTQHYPVFKSIGYTIRHSFYWPELTLQTAQAGALAIGHQFSVFNPIELAFDVILSTIPKPYLGGLFFATSHYLLLLVGFVLLCRVHFCNRLLTAAAVPALAGSAHIAHIYAAGWWTGMVGYAYLPWALAAVAWCGRAGSRHLILAVLAVALAISAGWPHATLAIALFVGVTALFRLGAGHYRLAFMTLLCGVSGAAVASASLFAVLSFGALAGRVSNLSNHDWFLFNLVDVLNLSAPALRPPFFNFNPPVLTDTLTYLSAFILPLCGLVDVNKLKAKTGPVLYPLAAFACVLLILTQGPDQIGPVRVPLRWLTPLHIAVLALWILALSHGRVETLSRGRLVWIFGAPLLAVVLTIVRAPQDMLAAALFLPVIYAGLGLFVFLRGRASRALALGLATVLIAIGVHAHSVPFFTNLSWTGLPKKVSGPPADLSEAPKSYRMLWAWDGGHATYAWDAENSVGSVNLLFARPAIGGYDSVVYKAFAEYGCLSPTGNFQPPCAHPNMTEAVRDWNRRDKPAGKTMFELLRIDAIDSSGPNDIASVAAGLGGDWTHSPGKFFEVFRPVRPLDPLPGTVSALTEGVSIVNAEPATVRTETLRIKTDERGGQIFFARLKWPGYWLEFNGAKIPLSAFKGFLVYADLPANAEGTLTLHYRSPKLALGLILAAVFLAIDGLVMVWDRKRRRSGIAKAA